MPRCLAPACCLAGDDMGGRREPRIHCLGSSGEDQGTGLWCHLLGVWTGRPPRGGGAAPPADRQPARAPLATRPAGARVCPRQAAVQPGVCFPRRMVSGALRLLCCAGPRRPDSCLYLLPLPLSSCAARCWGLGFRASALRSGFPCCLLLLLPGASAAWCSAKLAAARPCLQPTCGPVGRERCGRCTSSGGSRGASSRGGPC